METETERQRGWGEKGKGRVQQCLLGLYFITWLKSHLYVSETGCFDVWVEWEERCFTSRFLSIKFAPCWQYCDELLESSIQTMSISVSVSFTGEDWEIKQQGAEEGRTTGYNLLVYPWFSWVLSLSLPLRQPATRGRPHDPAGKYWLQAKPIFRSRFCAFQSGRTLVSKTHPYRIIITNLGIQLRI